MIKVNQSTIRKMDRASNTIKNSPIKRATFEKGRLSTAATYDIRGIKSSWIERFNFLPLSNYRGNIQIFAGKSASKVYLIKNAVMFWQAYDNFSPGKGLGKWMWDNMWHQYRVTGFIADEKTEKETNKEKDKKADEMAIRYKKVILPLLLSKEKVISATTKKKFKAYQSRVQRYFGRAKLV